MSLLCFSSLSFWSIQNYTPSASSDVVLAAEELRYAAQAVGRVTGEIGTEDVLDALFQGFCIGKWGVIVSLLGGDYSVVYRIIVECFSKPLKSALSRIINSYLIQPKDSSLACKGSAPYCLHLTSWPDIIWIIKKKLIICINLSLKNKSNAVSHLLTK